jgi:Outer membrane protein beta-barrel domain/Sigma-54 interaction domain/Bacterial regulatory protein, Fis family
MSTCRQLTSIALLTLIATAAAAADDTGFQLGASFGIAEHAQDVALGVPDVGRLTGETGGDDTSWAVSGSYRFNRNIAIEIGYVDFGEMDGAVTDVEGGSDARADFTFATSGVALTMVGSFPIGNWVPYLKAGVLFSETELDYSGAVNGTSFAARVDDDSEDASFGGGVGYDVRIISATHKDLRRCVMEGSFREDLYYRLSVVPIRLPSLRERADDIPLLIEFIVERLCAKHNVKRKVLDEEVVLELRHHSWPGNVRELENVLERALIMSGERITVMDLPEELLDGQPGAAPRAETPALKEFRDQAERDFILATLKRHGGNISQSALELGVRRPYLHRRMASLGITKRDYFL